MATNGADTAEPMRQAAEILRQRIKERAQLVTDAGDRAGRIIVETIENYARQTEAAMAFCEDAVQQCLDASAQLEPLAGRQQPAIDMDAMERETSAPPAPRMPGTPR